MLVSVYIRKADEELWKSLPKKTQAIHDLLNGRVERAAHLQKQLARVETKMVDELVETRVMPIINVPPSSMALACCLQRKPCIHWVFDGTSQTWTNSRTGEVKVIE